MKKVLLFAASGLLLLNSCSKDLDLYEDPVVPTTEVTAEDVKSNFKNITGVEYSPNMDWTTITSGQVDIQVDASVKKVQLLVDVQVENASDYVTPNDVRVLNEAVPNGRTSFTMTYDAPKANLGLYVGFLTDKTYIVKKIEGSKVTSELPATSRVTRGIADYVNKLPQGPFVIISEEDPYIEGLQSGYTHGKLYSLADADYGEDFVPNVNDYDNGSLKMAPKEYSSTFKETFKTMVFATFPNGRKDEQGKPINNLNKVYASGCNNEFSYGYTTSEDIPVVVTPVYKRDGAPKYGSEIYNSDLYYYYYSDAEYNAAADKKAFLKALPKYKAIPFKKCYKVDEDTTVQQRGSFALLYFENHQVGAEGTFKFPVGTKIGFMVRAKTDYIENGQARKKGELYLDGRLNDFINKYDEMNFKSSGFKGEEPRASWFSIEDHLYLCWETGTDADFNDIILEVEGLGGIVPPPPYYPQVFTFCFEDRKIGDYDLNDIVVKAVRTSETQLTYYLAACGAWDEVYVKNINKDEILDDVEVHAIFGVSTNTFINTESGKYVGMKTATKTVDQKFTFMDPQNQPWVYNKTQNDTIKLSLTGQDPHGIMLPFDFDYPLEKVPVTQAYGLFNNWVKEGKSVSETNWYVFPNESRVYTMRVTE